jgi:hypothetical protein
MAGSRLGVMDNFQPFVTEDRMLRRSGRTKATGVEAAAFLRTVRANEALPTEWLLSSVRASLAFTARAQ